MNKGIFINYQMAEAINLIDNPSTNKTLEDLKNDWLQDTIPGYNVKIGTSIPGMQDITLDEVYELREQAQQANTYTVQNCAAMQYCIVLDENKKFKTFDFSKLEAIIELAKRNQKKVIIDSAVVFGDLKNNNLANLTKEELKEVIKQYISTLTTRYGQYIERIDVFNAIFQRSVIDEENLSEIFWTETFGTYYPEQIIKLVRESINPQYKDIKLCWNEFYLSNPKYAERREAFLEMIKDLDIDCIGIQDRFTTGTTPEYIEQSLNKIAKVCQNCGKKVCITELSCTASGYDRANASTEEINEKIRINLNTINRTAQNNQIITSIEGAVSDKFDYNHQELATHKEHPRDISTTGKKYLMTKSNQEHNNELNSMFSESSIPKKENTEYKIEYKEKTKVKSLGTNQTNGYTNSTLLLISVLCLGLIIIIYMLIS